MLPDRQWVLRRSCAARGVRETERGEEGRKEGTGEGSTQLRSCVSAPLAASRSYLLSAPPSTIRPCGPSVRTVFTIVGGCVPRLLCCRRSSIRSAGCYLPSICMYFGRNWVLLSESVRRQFLRELGILLFSIISFLLTRWGFILSCLLSSAVMCTIMHLDIGAALQSSLDGRGRVLLLLFCFSTFLLFYFSASLLLCFSVFLFSSSFVWCTGRV